MTTPGVESGADAIHIREWRPGDDEAVLRCHNAVFADAARGRPERSLAHWRWKFTANPAGRVMQMLAVHADAGVVGVYGAIPMAVTCSGRRWLTAQCVDHCVRPEWLRYGGEGGLFPALGRGYLNRWLGTGADQAMFTYGLPVSGWRSGQRHLGWQIVRDWDITFREFTADAAPRATPAELVVRTVDRFDADTDALFTQLEPGFGLATVRDSAYLNWRYAEHPDRRYVLFECRERSSNRLRGVSVYGLGDVVRPHTGFVLDWLQASGDDDVMTAMLAAIEAAARRDRTSMLCSVWNHMDPRFLAMQEHGYRVRGTPWFLVVASALYDTIFFREQWYFTLGDSDLV